MVAGRPRRSAGSAMRSGANIPSPRRELRRQLRGKCQASRRGRPTGRELRLTDTIYGARTPGATPDPGPLFRPHGIADSDLARLHDRAADAHDLLPLPGQRPQQPRLHLERVRVDGDDDAAAARPDRLQNRLTHAQAPAQPAVLLVRLEI